MGPRLGGQQRKQSRGCKPSPTTAWEEYFRFIGQIKSETRIRKRRWIWHIHQTTDTAITKQVLSWNPWLTKKHLVATTCNRHLHHQTSALLEPVVDQETPGGNNLQQTLTSPNKCSPGTHGWLRNTWRQQLATDTYITKQVLSWNPWLTKKHLAATTCNRHLHHQTSALLEPMVDQETPGGNNLQQTLTSPNKCSPGTHGWPRNTWRQQLATDTYITKQVLSWNPWLTKKHLAATTCNRHQQGGLHMEAASENSPGQGCWKAVVGSLYPRRGDRHK